MPARSASIFYVHLKKHRSDIPSRESEQAPDRLQDSMLIASSHDIDNTKWQRMLRGDHYWLREQDQLKLAWLSDRLSVSLFLWKWMISQMESAAGESSLTQHPVRWPECCDPGWEEESQSKIESFG